MNLQPLGATTSSPVQTAPAANSSNLATEDTFLKLLVAQIRNQDPLNPSDSIQFVSQLAEFSNLEQNLQMRQDLDAIRTALTAAPATTTNNGSTSH